MIDPALRERVEQWRDDDPDPVTAAELDELLVAGDEAALRERFDQPLSFGTAGLRGAVGAGPGRMNRAVVRRTAAAIARWLDEANVDGPVVVGRDARHGSAEFADDTARVLAAAGRDVLSFPDPVPTPLLAFALLDAGAAAGIMVTASHNPRADNGYKVYASHGAQIAPPMDEEIARHIAEVGLVSDIVLADADADADADDRRLGMLGADVVERYVTGVARLRVRPDVAGPRVAYTAMHGVGGDVLRRAFEEAGLDAPVAVEAQDRPDPDFPTAAFPNPEEPGAMDLLLALAADGGVDLALANDPDADRLAVAVPVDDGWRTLTGDEVGVLLADHLLRHGTGDDRFVATTVVSSTLLASVAASYGVECAETLTRFKWLAQAARGRSLTLAYEEALGYCVGDLVHDKDGIGAAVVVAELAGVLASEGSSIPDRLDEIARAHGLHLTEQWSNRFEGIDGADRMTSAVDSLRREPPSRLGSFEVTEVEDLAPGGRLPPTDAVILRGEGMRVVVRPSGTEPKLKAYVEVVVPVDASVAEARSAGSERIAAVVAAVASLLS